MLKRNSSEVDQLHKQTYSHAHARTHTHTHTHTYTYTHTHTCMAIIQLGLFAPKMPTRSIGAVQVARPEAMCATCGKNWVCMYM